MRGGALKALLVGLALGACGDEAPDPAWLEAEAARQAALAAMTEQIVLPSTRALKEHTATLVTRVEALTSDPLDTTGRRDLRTAWSRAMEAWQEVEVLSGFPEAARSLGASIYGWPDTAPCDLDVRTAADTLAGGPFGLEVIELLALVDATDNRCADTHPLNADAVWDDLPESVIRQRRIAQALVASRALADAAARLDAGWKDAGGYRDALAARGTLHPFPDAHATAVGLIDALAEAAARARDLKLGAPLDGQGCAGGICRERFESRVADRAKENLEANLRATRRLFTGHDATAAAREAPGFLHAVLWAEGQAAAADAVLSAIDRAEGALMVITTDLESAAFNNRDQVEAVMEAFGALFDALDGVVREALGG